MHNNVMDLRPYLPTDRDGCLAIFDSISPTNRTKFEDFLDHPDGPFFVMEHDGAAIGCRGYTIGPEQGQSTLVWGMVRSGLQRQGLGRFLLMFRLREIGKNASIQRVLVETSNQAARFFEGQGFKVVHITGDRVQLLKKLTVCP